MFYGVITILSLYICLFGIILSIFVYYFTYNKNFKNGIDGSLSDINNYINNLNGSLKTGESISRDSENAPADFLSAFYFVLNTLLNPIKTIVNDGEHLFSGAEDHVKDAFGSVKNVINNIFG